MSIGSQHLRHFPRPFEHEVEALLGRQTGQEVEIEMQLTILILFFGRELQDPARVIGSR